MNVTAREAFAAALADHVTRLPCRTDPGAWYGDAAQRAEAVAACQRCPLTAPCLAAATEADEEHGVWGARDFQATTSHTAQETA